MMAIIEHFLAQLSDKGIRLESLGDRLTVHAPKGTVTKDLAGQIRHRKTEILAFMAMLSQSSKTSIPLVPRDKPLPMSFSQQRLWFLDQLAKSTGQSSSQYNMCMLLEGHGHLDARALEQAAQKVILRHENLRTQFRQVDGKPVQEIRTGADFHLRICDVGSLNPSARQALIVDETGYAFDLASEPLIRLTLLLINPDHFYLLTNLHHIISDGWSNNLFVNELISHYEAIAEDKPILMEPLTVQYADFSHWQQQREQQAVLAEQAYWWAEKLRGMAPVHQLPLDRPRPKIVSNLGQIIQLEMDSTVLKAIEPFTKSQRITDFMVILAAFKVLLSQYSQQRDIALGTAVANRTKTEIEPLIGFFVNTLVLRTEVDPKLTFRELLHRVRQTCLEAYAHQDVPFEQVVDHINPYRHLDHSPLFQITFAHSPPADIQLKSPKLSLKSLPLESGMSKFDLSLNSWVTANGLHTRWEFNTDLFQKKTIENMANHFCQLFQLLLASPDLPIASLSRANQSQQLALFKSLTRPDFEISEALGIHEYFEQQVARQPDHIAVIQTGHSGLTYDALNRKANQIAWYLRKQGMQPEAKLGLLAGSSPELLIGMLAILKIGGAIVPLDGSLPQARFQHMLKDSQISMVLHRGELPRDFPSMNTLDLNDPQWGDLPDENLYLPVHSHQAAFLIYTSGSTGTPKASINTHRGLVNHHLWIQANYPMAPMDRMLYKSPLIFDASFWEIPFPLMVGAQIVLAKDGLTSDLAELKRAIETHRVTHAVFVPSMLRAFLTHLNNKPFTSHLKDLVLGGETITPADHQRALILLQNPNGAVDIRNHYGPSEAAISCLNHRLWDQTPGDAIAIGRPEGNMQAYIVDAAMRLVPAGMPGELVIAGPNVSRGYHARPDLTASQFVPNPFDHSRPGSRLYRTGDLVRLKHDGQIYFLQRMDHQIKLRGMRLELGEIEAKLAEHTQVTQAVVVLQELENKDQHLVGYLTLADSSSHDLLPELKQTLRQELPAYMVPSMVKVLEEMPLLPSGKISRRALAMRPLDLSAQTPDTFRKPETELEKDLAAIWSEVLDREQVGLDDHFFEIGGHSLLATQVTSRIRETLGREVPLQKVFTLPTVASLAEWLSSDSTIRKLPTITPRSEPSDSLPLSFAQQRLWFLDQLLRAEDIPTNHYNISLVLRVMGAMDIPALGHALGQLEQRHEVLRTQFHEIDGRPLQVIRQKPVLTIRQEDGSGLSEEAILNRVNQISAQGFDLQNDPLLRLDLLRRDEQEHLLVLNMHHIISDGWSMNILVKELVALYREARGQGEAQLPELPVQYGDFSTWQQSDLFAEDLQRQAQWWQNRLADLPVVHQIPTDRPRPRIQTQNGASFQYAVDEDVCKQLESLAQDSGGTLFMVLLSAFQLLIAKYSGQSDIAVGTPIANRNQAEIEPLIGFFVNTLVLRAQVNQGDSFHSLLSQVIQTTTESYDHQDVPFEKLVDLLQPERHTSHAPLFQIMFSLQNAPGKAMALPDVTLKPVKTENQTAKFDLQLDMIPAGNGLVAHWQFNRDLFDRHTIETMGFHFRQLLTAILKQPEAPMSQLTMLENAAREKLISNWGQNPWPIPHLNPVHCYIEDHARTHPDHIALVVDDHRDQKRDDVTYWELNRQANRCAWKLLESGLKPETRVGLMAKSSPELVIGILAILKAGGVVVPVDPNTPQERQQYMLQDSGVAIVLGQAHCVDWVSELQVHCLDLEENNQLGDHNPQVPITTDHAAFLLYTSGSTGNPKASINTHHGLVNHNLWVQHFRPLKPFNRVLYKTPIGFDAAMWEILWPLMAGAQLVIGPEDIAGDPFELLRLIEVHDVTDAYFVPSMLRAFLDQLDEKPFISKLKQIFTGGEALLPQDQHRAQSLLQNPDGPIQVTNLYGPSEASITATSYACDAQPHQGVIPIGRPFANANIFILDPFLKLVPQGVPGQLVIGGNGLSRGYQGRPALTASKFVPNPLSELPGSRIYLTGDLARHRHDGEILYLGRTDHQIKLRGMRIELGEIEARLKAQEGVDHACVVLSEDARGEKHLVAFLQTQTSAMTAFTETLRHALKANIPAYMIPQTFVQIDAWPYLPSGKISYQQLGKLAKDHTSKVPFTGEYVAPRNDIESTMATIWKEILGLERVSVHANFFEVGGHSLLATQVLSRMRQAFPEKLSLQYLFEKPTIADISEGITNIRKSLDSESFTDNEFHEEFEY